MNHPVVEQHQQIAILYDPLWTGKISSDWFVPQYWQTNAAATEQGRGSSYFIQHDEQQWVLRQYQRGGLAARIVADQYLWTGLQQTRPWREWQLLALMYDNGLPVPKPVAAQVFHQGFFYRGAILIERITDAVSLSSILQKETLVAAQWRAIGTCIQRFHQQGIYHADLNAHNILVRQSEVFLIDFDKGEQRPKGHWCQANLKRLFRSLSKLSNQHPCFAFNADDWQQLVDAYQASA